jgi:hypothetical protein
MAPGELAHLPLRFVLLRSVVGYTQRFRDPILRLEQALSRADSRESPERTHFREAARQQCRNLHDFIVFAPADLPAEDSASSREQPMVEVEQRASRESANVLA